MFDVLKQRKMAVAVAVAAALAAGGVGAYAAIPGSDGKITGCYNGLGALRVIDGDSGASCTAGETKLTWAQKGIGQLAAYDAGKDAANGYDAGDVVRVSCGASTYGSHGGATYVKVKKAAEPYTLGNSLCGATGSGSSWALVDQDGTTGPTGMRGAQGPAGPANAHWAKFSANNTLIAASEKPDQTYPEIPYGYAYVSFPGVDPNKCAITVTPAATSSNFPFLHAGYWIYQNLILGYLKDGSGNFAANVGMDIVANCSQSTYTP